jgi:purine nucleosidase/pyrimidine-specific ribonucleoside hydrolase
MQQRTPTRVIIDTDAGADDALAILLALASPELEVVGVTTVCGNVPVGQATKNLFRILALTKAPPGLLVGQGAARPLEEELVTAVRVFGGDGLGDLDEMRTAGGVSRYPQARLPPLLSTAQDVWNDCVRRYPDELTLITLGPLTNVALSLKVNPLTVHRFHSVIVMGGAIGVPGNVAPAAEFNIYVDPHAAHRVFQASLPLTLVPLDVTTKVWVERDTVAAWAAESHDPTVRIVTDVTGKAFDFAERVEGHGRFYFHDPLAVLAAVDPSLMTLESMQVSIEKAGSVARGMTIADRRILKPEQRPVPNVQVAVDVDAPRALNHLRSRLCPWS